MTRTTNARVAGATFLLYIAAGIASMVVFGRATRGVSMAEKFTSIAAHETSVGIVVLLGFVQAFSAVLLGVTLWAITRDEDSDLAMLGLACRLGEGVIAGLAIPTVLAIHALATSGATDAPTIAAAHTLASYLMRSDVAVPAMFFAVGSLAFSWLMLRGRMIPVPLAWLGVVASVVLVIGLPLRLAGFLEGRLVMLMWLPMLAFEVPLGLWLIFRGAAGPSRIPAT